MNQSKLSCVRVHPRATGREHSFPRSGRQPLHVRHAEGRADPAQERGLSGRRTANAHTHANERGLLGLAGEMAAAQLALLRVAHERGLGRPAGGIVFVLPAAGHLQPGPHQLSSTDSGKYWHQR